MKLWWKLGWRELIRNPRFTLLFIINLALGLSGFVVITSFGSALQHHLQSNLQTMLTADMVVRSSRPLTEAEGALCNTLAGADSMHSEQISFYSMVKGEETARLAHIIAIDSAYPLYGTLEYQDNDSHAEVIRRLQRQRLLLLTDDAARSLGLVPGVGLKIGQSNFRVAALIRKDPAAGFSGVELAPTVYLGLAQVRDTGLIRFGSRVTYKRFIRLPSSADAGKTAEVLTRALQGQTGEDAGIRVSTTTDVNRRLGRIVGFFSEFLGFAGLISLFLSSLASAYLFREHLRTRVKEIAILLSLGARRWQCLALHALKLAILGTVAALVALAVARLFLPLFAGLFSGFVPDNLVLTIGPRDALLALLVALMGSLVFCLPVYQGMFSLKPIHLFHETFQRGQQGRLLPALSLLPGVALFFVLAVSLSRSVIHGAVFVCGLAGIILLLAAAGGLLADRCGRWSGYGGLTGRLILRNLYRNRVSAVSLFTAVAVAMVLTALVPQLEKGLLAEISQPEGMDIPVLFLVDIQEDQYQPLIDFFQGTGHQLSPLAPMVQGRIVSVNQVPFARWRLQQGNSENILSRRTEFNFSSRDELDMSESIVKGRAMTGQAWTGETDKPFEISMEQRFGEQLGVGLGDRLVFDVQGIELEGMIVNLRTVRWNSFQPNFFMLVQKGVLDDAPKTYLASVSQVDSEKKPGLVNRLNSTFSNISVIDVTRMVAQLDDIAGKLARSLRFMAALALVTGLVAVFSIVRQETLRREREINLLRVLGADANRIRRLTMLEFGLLGGMAGLVAVVLSYACSWSVAWLLFDRIWRFQLWSGLLLLAAAALICAATALIATESVLWRKAAALLE